MWITKPFIAFFSGAVFVISVLLTAIGTAILFAIDIPELGALSNDVKVTIISITTILLLISASLFTFQRYAVIQDLKIKLDNRRNLQQKVDHLAQLRSQAINQIYAKTPKVSEFEEWEKKYESWKNKVEVYLEANFPFAIVEMFTDLGMITPLNFLHASKDHEIRSRHLKDLQMLVKELTIIENIIRENTELTIESPVTILDLIKWQEQS